MAELLSVATAATCSAEKQVSHGDDADQSGLLVCNLQSGHPGPLHYDWLDKVWWSADA